MLKIYSLVFFLFFASQTYAQWTQTSGPIGGYVQCFTAGPDGAGGTNILAGTVNGVYISTDYGKKWIFQTLGFPEYSVSALAMSGRNIFAGTYGDNAVYRSTNYGKNWSPASSGLPKYYSPDEFAVCDTNVLVALAGEIYLSSNNGISWIKDSSGLPVNRYIGHLGVNGKYIFVALSTQGIYRSTDNGKSWNAAGSGLPKNSTAFEFAVSETNIFAAIKERGVYLSTDNGESWSAVNSGLPNDSPGYIYIQALVASGTNIYASTFDGLFLSNDNGAHWKKISLGFPWPNDIQDLAVIGSVVIAAAEGGIYRSSDGGVNWAEEDSGFINSEVNVIAVNGGNIFAGGIPSRWKGGLYHSTDNGESWMKDSFGYKDTTTSNYPFINDFAVNGTNTFAGGGIGNYGWSSHAFLSVHNGKDWTDMSSELPEGSFIKALAVSGKNLFAAVQSWDSAKVFVSADNGKSWTKEAQSLPLINDLAVKGSNIFAAAKDRVYVSTDTCKSWTSVSSGLPKDEYSEIVALAVCDSFLFASSSYWEGVFLSTDNGASWYPNRAFLSNINSFAVKGQYIFAASGNRVFMSNDYCRTAIEMNAGLPIYYEYLPINALALNETEIFAATSRGVWKRPLSDMTTSAERHSPEIPAQFRLEQNYPNPFNPKTTISYSIAEQSYVELRIYDILGREVAALVSKEQNTGEFRVQFDGTSLPSGVYIYTIKAGQFRDAKKLILLK